MILFISHCAKRSGAPILLLHLLKWLRANTAYDLRAVIRGDGPLVESFRSEVDTFVVESPMNTIASRFLRLTQRVRSRIQPNRIAVLPSAWRDQPIELIYANTITNGRLVSKLTKKGVPVITHVHELGYWTEQSGIDNLRQVESQTTRFIAASNAVKDYLANKWKLPSDRIDVVHEFVPSLGKGGNGNFGIRGKLHIPDNAFVVGASGQESWRKGRDLFVQLAANVLLLAPSANIHFLWVGCMADKEDQWRLEHDAVQSGVGDRVHWTGEVANPEPYFSEFDLFAMVSREDPFPLVCLEAALLGKPILCFANAGGIPELVEADAGFIVPHLDVHAMACRVVELAGNRALMMRLGNRAKAKVMERHTIEKAGPLILHIIQRELARRI